MTELVTSILVGWYQEVDGSGGRANLVRAPSSYMGTNYSWAFWSPIQLRRYGGFLMDDWESVEQWKIDD